MVAICLASIHRHFFDLPLWHINHFIIEKLLLEHALGLLNYQKSAQKKVRYDVEVGNVVQMNQGRIWEAESKANFFWNSQLFWYTHIWTFSEWTVDRMPLFFFFLHMCLISFNLEQFLRLLIITWNLTSLKSAGNFFCFVLCYRIFISLSLLLPCDETWDSGCAYWRMTYIINVVLCYY